MSEIIKNMYESKEGEEEKWMEEVSRGICVRGSNE